MSKFYLVFGIAVCALFVYAYIAGFNILDFTSVQSNKPKGPGAYHK